MVAHRKGPRRCQSDSVRQGSGDELASAVAPGSSDRGQGAVGRPGLRAMEHEVRHITRRAAIRSSRSDACGPSPSGRMRFGERSVARHSREPSLGQALRASIGGGGRQPADGRDSCRTRSDASHASAARSLLFRSERSGTSPRASHRIRAAGIHLAVEVADCCSIAACGRPRSSRCSRLRRGPIKRRPALIVREKAHAADLFPVRQIKTVVFAGRYDDHVAL